MDHIALYRPGTGIFWVLKNTNGTFSAVYGEGDPGNGLGNYNLKSPGDVAMAFDWNRSGKNDHVALYRPGTVMFWVVKRAQGAFQSVFAEQAVGEFDLKNPEDKTLAFDYDGSKQSDHSVLYRPNGSGTIWILKHTG